MGEITTAKSHILFDGAIIPQPDDALFEPIAENCLGEATGRGAAIFFSHSCGECVVRHYRRGGFPAKLSADRYLALGLDRSRPWLEWRLLDRLYRQGLPVPRPVAARLIRHGIFYEADIIMLRIDASPLAELLMTAALSDTGWQTVGQTIARFHAVGLDHADLNARNILEAADGKCHLIDLDRSTLKSPQQRWQAANLSRLQRSLTKFHSHQREFYYSPEDWQALMTGYRAGLAAAQ